MPEKGEFISKYLLGQESDHKNGIFCRNLNVILLNKPTDPP